MAVQLCSGQTSYTNASAWLNAQADIVRTGPTTARVTVYWQLYTAGSSLNSADRWIHIMEPNGNYPASGYYIGGSWAYNTEYGTNRGAAPAQFDITISPYASSITLGVKVLAPGAAGGQTLTWDGGKKTSTGSPEVQYGALGYPAYTATITMNHYAINVPYSQWNLYTTTSAAASCGTTFTPSAHPIGITGFHHNAAITNQNYPAFTVTGDRGVNLYYERNAVSIAIDAAGGAGGSMAWNAGGAVYQNGGTLTPPTRQGYTFAGWTKVSGTFTLSGNTVSAVTASGSVRASWRANTYTLTYNGNGGTTPAAKSVTYDAAYGTLATSTRKGFEFLGWFTSPTGGTQVTASTVCKGSATVYARWKIKTLYDRVIIYTAQGIKIAKPYIRVNGVWKGAAARMGNGSQWKQTAVNPELIK